MKSKGFFRLCAMILALSVAHPAPANEVRPENTLYSVLFISSYHPSFPTFFDQVEGLRSVLKSPTVNLDIEFMDAKRFNQQQLQGVFYTNLARKLEQLPKYDLVITGDDAATHFAVDHRDDLFADLPIVFFGVNDLAFAASFDRDANVTGVMERASFADTIRLIGRLMGDTEVMVITDGTLSAQADTRRFLQDMQTINFSDFRMMSLATHSFDDMLSEVEKLELPASLLLISIFCDKTGKVQDFDRTFMDIRHVAKVPIFHLWQPGINEGVLGGKLLSHRTMAHTAAQMAMQILEGDSPANIPVKNTPTHYVVDYREMARFGLDLDALPADTQIVNAPDPIYQTYREYIVTSILILVLLSITIIVLLLRIRARQAFAKQMLSVNEALESKVHSRTAALELANDEVENILRLRDSILDNSLVSIVLTKARRIEWINDYAEIMFGYSEDDVIGREPDFLYLHEDDYNRFNSEAPQLLRRGEKYRADFAFRCKDGTVLWGMVSGKAINPENLEEGILYIVVDITARKQAEEQLKLLNAKLEAQATTDHLTGISNRRHAVKRINGEIKKAQRYKQPFAVIMVDVDFFKKLNDSYGHSAGDHVLKQIAALLKGTCRQVDTVARWGGEEFLVLCPLTPLSEAKKLAELLRVRMETHEFGLPCRVTASFGVAAYRGETNLEEIIQEADKALYTAKTLRNCVRAVAG